MTAHPIPFSSPYNSITITLSSGITITQDQLHDGGGGLIALKSSGYVHLSAQEVRELANALSVFDEDPLNTIRPRKP